MEDVTPTAPVRVDMVQKARRPRGHAPGLEELGTTGLRHYGGFIAEEWLTRLAGRRGAWVYREMADNDPVIGAILFAIEMLARSVDCRVEPGADEDAAELVEQCKDDMSHTWEDFVAEALSMLVYGWSYGEIVYKRRLGPDPGYTVDSAGRRVPLPQSRYDDGRIGWRKLPFRAQETLERWEIADDGGLNGMAQVAYDGVRRTIPMEKALLFRTTARRGNPEGRSILRNAYVAWFRKKNIEEIEAIGVERDLAGIPMMTAPEGTDIHAKGNEAILQAAQELVTSVRRDEDEGIVKNHGWEFELVTTGGSRQLDTDKIIRRYDMRIASVVLADFILLAQDKVGSKSLGEQKVATFQQAMQVWLVGIAEVLNRYAIPRLLRINGMPVVDPPRFVFGDIDETDLEKLGTFFVNLYAAGAPIQWTPELMRHLFVEAKLPEPPEDEAGGDAALPPDDAHLVRELRRQRQQARRQPEDTEPEGEAADA